MFYQHGNDAKLNTVNHGPRIRLFYPDGRIEWASLEPNCEIVYNFTECPCYVPEHFEDEGRRVEWPDSLEHALTLANMHDVTRGYEPQEFLGYL